MKDRIEIRKLRVATCVGATAEERARPQSVSVSLAMEVQGGLQGLGDDLAKTVDYYAVSEVVRDLAASGERCLIESLAEEISEAVLRSFAVERVEVEVEKYVLADAAGVAVKLEKGREQL